MRKSSFLPGLVALFSVFTAIAPAQSLVHDRIQPLSSASARATISKNVAPRALRATDLGAAAENLPVQSIALRFSLTEAQQQALTQLETAQQNPSSPLYHQWLTPQQYGAQFGLSADDLATVTTWLGTQGFTNVQVANSRSFVTFSGTAAQVNNAFGTTLHTLQSDGETHFGNLTDPTLPAVFASVVNSITGLDDFRPRPRVKVRTVPAPNPQFTSSIFGNTYLAPGDLYTIYNTNPLLTSSINGAGITIAVMGQTDIALTDIAAFRSASGLTAKAPTIQLYGADPGISSTDLPEASLDVEWSGAMAPAATILFVNSTNVIDGSLTQAIDNNVAPIITISYGDCETGFGSSGTLSSFNQLFRQANVQGQTILGPAGDAGATDCEYNNTTGFATTGLAVDFPASSPYVTGVGGTEFNENGGTYFSATNGAFQGSALSYIPERVWNDDVTVATATMATGLAAGGGGASLIFTKPPYQVGIGVPNDFSRDVPDVALTASVAHDAYLFCEGGSCTNGFRDSSSNLNVVGGTSVSTPSFAGIMALLEQKIQSRVGNANPIIYGLANSAYYATVFNDVTVGTNASPCQAGSTNCSNGGTIGFAAGVGYDQATGWGSVNAANLVADWLLVTPAGSSVVQGFNTPSVTIIPAMTSVTQGAADSLNVTVASATSGLTTVPTGTVQLLIDGAASGTAVTLVSGATTLSVPTAALASGGHTISVVYSGDGTYTGAKGSFTLDIVAAAVADFSLSPSSANLTIQPGASGSLTYTVAPVNGFTGVVTFTASETTNTLTGTYTFTPASVTITGTTAGTTVFSLSAFEAALKSGNGQLKFAPARTAAISQPATPGRSAPWKLAATGAAMAGLCFLVFPRRRRRWSALLAAVLTLGILGVSGCSDNGPPNNINSAPGTYTLLITATSGTLTHTSTITLNIP